jgi:hypothetical protein
MRGPQTAAAPTHAAVESGKMSHGTRTRSALEGPLTSKRHGYTATLTCMPGAASPHARRTSPWSAPQQLLARLLRLPVLRQPTAQCQG